MKNKLDFWHADKFLYKSKFNNYLQFTDSEE